MDAEIAQLEGFKKELELIPITIGNLVVLVDNYVRAKKELLEREIEIKQLRAELASLNSEHINFNNVSLVKQQDKLVNDLQIEIAYLKKQLAKHTSNPGNTNNVPANHGDQGRHSPKLGDSAKSETAESTSYTQITSDSSVAAAAVNTTSTVSNETEPKKRGRKAATSKTKAEITEVAPVAPATPITPDETPIEKPKRSRKKK